MRRLAPLLAAAVLAASCGGGAAAPSPTAGTPTDADLAAEYARSARRAVDTTRFARVTDDEVAAMVLTVCGDLAASSDPDGVVLSAVASIDAPAGDPSDDEIMAVVLAEGAVAVCPDEVDAATMRAWEAAAPEDRFLAAVEMVAPVLEPAPTGDGLLAAGRHICEGLDAGDPIDDVVVRIFDDLFGVTGLTFEEIAAGEVGEREGLLAGGVLGSAATFLCPGHRETVTAYLEALAEEQGE
ncbi:MAG: DUF732 domain-containing protein [Actinobacteria bacterium]|nr:DUF732 domain-containing protein [Actinomycetota bacterium]